MIRLPPPHPPATLIKTAKIKQNEEGLIAGDVNASSQNVEGENGRKADRYMAMKGVQGGGGAGSWGVLTQQQFRIQDC